MRCMRCACEVTLGWMEVVSHRVNPHTGETVTRLLCEACADAVEGRQSPSERPARQNSELTVKDVGAALLGERGMTQAVTTSDLQVG